MALITCPECGKEISSDAQNCPHCGKPLQYIACPYCSSKDIQPEKEGYNGLKGAAGYIAVGPLGLLAGTHGSHDIKLHCLSCGKSFDIDDVIKIDNRPTITNNYNKYAEIARTEGKLVAVKAYKDDHNCDLKEAKEYIDSLNVSSPQPQNTNKGCMIAIIAISSTIVGLMSLFGVFVLF